MSRWSGKADFADHIAGMGGWYDRDGNPVEFGQKGVYAYYSDELKDFRAFKEKTGGVMYQHKRIKNIDEWNQKFIKDHCPGFNYVEHVNKIADKRCKSGVREEKYFTYTYFGQEYTQKEINKKGVYITVEIHFDTLLDIIKYYPYIVSSCYSSEGKHIVYLSDRSFVDEEYDRHLQHGFEGLKADYDKKLAEHYLEVAKDYYLRDLDERECFLFFDTATVDHEDDKYIYYKTVRRIDDLHKAEWYFINGQVVLHWDDPKIIDEHTIRVTKVNITDYLKDAIANENVCIKYIERPAIDLVVLG